MSRRGGQHRPRSTARRLLIVVLGMAALVAACSGGGSSDEGAEVDSRVVADGGEEIDNAQESNEDGSGASSRLDPDRPDDEANDEAANSDPSGTDSTGGSTSSNSGSSSETTEPPLRMAEVRVTFDGVTKRSSTSMSFDVDQHYPRPWSYEAANGAAVSVASVSPSSKCEADAEGVGFIENEARVGDVCVVKLEVAAEPGYEASTVVVNITGRNDCFVSWSIAQDTTSARPGDRVTFDIQPTSSGSCSTSIGCRVTNMVDNACEDNDLTIDPQACARSDRASFTVYTVSAGTLLWDDRPATATWSIDCSQAGASPTDENGSNETGSNETGSNETGSDDTGSDENGTGETTTDENGTGETTTDGAGSGE